MKKYLALLIVIFLIAATTSPNRFYELILYSGNFWVDTNGAASFADKVTVGDLQVGSLDFDMSTVDDGELLGRSGTDIIGVAGNSFTGLADTPGSYTADSLAAVNSAGNALEFINTEADLESKLSDVTNLITNNDDFADLPGAPAYDNGKFLQSTASGVQWATPAGAGTVTSVALSGTDGIEIDSGSPVVNSGTIQLGINITNLLTHLGVEAGATADLTSTEVETLYNNQVALATQAQAEAGTSTEVLRWTPELIGFAVAALTPVTGYTFDDSQFTIYNNLDNTKTLIFNLDDITTGTERELTFPDADIDFGNIPDSLISNTLTASIFNIDGTTSAVDLDSSEVAGQLPNSKIVSMEAGKMKGREIGLSTGAQQDLGSLEIREIITNPTAVTSSSSELNWNGDTTSKVYHTMTEDTTVQDNSGTPNDLQMVLFVITQSASNNDLDWDSVFVNPDGTMPELQTGTGDISMYGFTYIAGRSEYVLSYFLEYDVP